MKCLDDFNKIAEKIAAGFLIFGLILSLVLFVGLVYGLSWICMWFCNSFLHPATPIGIFEGFFGLIFIVISFLGLCSLSDGRR